MKVCVIRNAEACNNAGLLRIVDALTHGGHEPVLFSRNRNTITVRAKIIAKSLPRNTSVMNHEIQLTDVVGRGGNNIFPLIIYQVLVFFWLLCHGRFFDAFHAFDLDAGFPALLAAKICRRPLVYHIADFYVDSRPGIPGILKRLVRSLEFFVIAHAALTIICTEERIQQIAGSKPRKLIVVHNSPFCQPEMLPNSYRTDSRLHLCYVGSLEENRFIKSAVEVVSQEPRVKLTLAGMNTLQDYVQDAANRYPNINYLGQVSYWEALKLYSTCDLMFAVYDPAVPNHRYSAPNKVYEAMMLGKLLIVAKNTGFDSLIEREGIGLSIDYSQQAFKQALDYFLANPDMLKKMGKRARQVYARYSWSVMRERLLRAYADLEDVSI